MKIEDMDMSSNPWGNDHNLNPEILKHVYKTLWNIKQNKGEDADISTSLDLEKDSEFLQNN